jgi:CARDB
MHTIDRRRFNTGLVLGLGLAGCGDPEPGAPDLVVTGIRWSEDEGATWHTGPIRAGSDVWFEADVRNQGTGPKPDGVTIGVRFRANGKLVSWWHDDAQSLPAGATTSLRANGGPAGDRYWNKAQAGSYTIRAEIDHGDRIPNELDETNNKLDLQVLVEGGAALATAKYWGFQTGRTENSDNTVYWRKMVDAQQDMGITTIRFSTTGRVEQVEDGEVIDWTLNDDFLAYLRGRGVVLHTTADPRTHSKFFSSGTTRLPEAEWRANWRYYVREYITRYKDNIRYFICTNEPDLGANAMTTDEIVKAQQDAWNEIKAIDPAILVESAPPGNQNSLPEWFAAGLADCADLIGMHEYGGGMRDDNMQDVPKFLAAEGISKPRAISEFGDFVRWESFGNWPIGSRQRSCAWYRQAHTIIPFWGHDHVLFFAYDHGEESLLVSTSTNPVTKPQPLWDIIKTEVLPPHGLLNPGFERPVSTANAGLGPAGSFSKSWPWYILHDIDDGPAPDEWDRCHFVTGDGANARTGTGYLKMEVGLISRTLFARQAVWGLSPNQQYTVTAYAFLTGSGTAMLSVRGYDRLNGLAITSQSTTLAGAWQQLQVVFTPDRDRVGIELRGSGSSGHIRWDDVSIGSA